MNTGQQKNHISGLLSSLQRQHHRSTSLTTTDPSMQSRLLALAAADHVEIIRTTAASGVLPTLLRFGGRRIERCGGGRRGRAAAEANAAGAAGVDIWILATPISSFGPSISCATFDIEDFDIECPFDIDVCTFDIVCRYRRCSISKVSSCDIEGHKPSISKVINSAIDIEVSSLRYRTLKRSTSYVDIVYDIEGLSHV